MCKQTEQIPWLEIIARQDPTFADSDLPAVVALEQWLAKQMRRPVTLLFVELGAWWLRWQVTARGWLLQLHPCWLRATCQQWLSLSAMLLQQGACRGGFQVGEHGSHPAAMKGWPAAAGVASGFGQERQRHQQQPQQPQHTISLQPHPHPQLTQRPVAPGRRLVTGKIHDLQQLLSEENQRYFDNCIQATIRWGRVGRGKRRSRRSLQLGSYCASQGLIRIHPCLDEVMVPGYFVRWVVFHEMLHEVFEPVVRGGRRQVHPPAFRAAERQHPDYVRAHQWEQANVARLLRWQPS